MADIAHQIDDEDPPPDDTTVVASVDHPGPEHLTSEDDDPPAEPTGPRTDVAAEPESELPVHAGAGLEATSEDDDPPREEDVP